MDLQNVLTNETSTSGTIWGYRLYNRVMEESHKELKHENVTYLVPVVSKDGHFFINKERGIELHFLQSRPVKDPKYPKFDSVAAVRFDTIDELKDLERALHNKVRELENPES